MDNITAARILEILQSDLVLSEFGLTSDFLDQVRLKLRTVNSNHFLPLHDVDDKSPGLEVFDNEVRLSMDWGIKLDGKKNAGVINKPSCITFKTDKFLIGDGDSTNVTLAGSVFDVNLNYLGQVGKKGTNLGSGEVPIVNDFEHSTQSASYYLVSTDSHIVQIYDDKNKAHTGAIGTGVAGVDGTQITSPVALAVGTNGILYVLCNKGEPAGATVSSNSGFVAKYQSDGTFMEITLYQGLTNGSGSCFSGEIANAKDMVVTKYKGKDHLLILNGNNEIGLFDASSWKLVEIYNVPTSVSDAPDLDKITLDDKFIYAVSSSTGQVLAIDRKDRQLRGKFGTLADESSADAKSSLGKFNGLSGIAVVGNKIYTSESTNRRVQAYGTEMLDNSNFFVTLSMENIPNQKSLVDIVYSLKGNGVEDVKVLDTSNQNAELEVATAVARNIKAFKIKLILDPTRFDSVNKTLEINPVYILTKEFR
jgi:hypothetical protein